MDIAFFKYPIVNSNFFHGLSLANGDAHDSPLDLAWPGTITSMFLLGQMHRWWVPNARMWTKHTSGSS